jgi:hypothetical protein
MVGKFYITGVQKFGLLKLAVALTIDIIEKKCFSIRGREREESEWLVIRKIK